MNKVLSGRLISVLIVTALCLWYVYPTINYYLFVGKMSDPPTAEQVEQERALLDGSNMINLGLDLRGGVDFLIAVDSETYLEEKLRAELEELRQAFQAENVDAGLELLPEQNAIRLTLNEPARDRNLASDILTRRAEREVTMLNVSNLGGLEQGSVVLSTDQRAINREMNTAVDAALENVRRRVDQYGLTQPEVVRQGQDRIRVLIPGETDPEKVRQTLLRVARLEFRLLHPNMEQELQNFVDATGRVREDLLETVASEEVAGAEITRLKPNIPGVPPGYQLFLGQHTSTDSQTGEVTTLDNLGYLLRDRAEISGEQLNRAYAYTDPSDIDDPIKVSLEFDSAGTEKFAEITKDNVGQRFAIVLDSKVFSAPVIRDPILTGRAEISGGFTQRDAQDLALVLKAGQLEAPLKVVNQQAVGASLGVDSILASGRALIIGAILLIIFMVAIYRAAGIIAVLAMFINVLMILAVLSLADATLTLSGIAGVLLTMGMAVDANVLIYERLREELQAGRPIRAAINSAFGRAFTVILDSNITTLLPALVLILFEIAEGSVRGFWVAMAIGLLANLYTGLTVTRALVESWVAKNKTISIGEFNPFKNVTFDWMAWRRIGFPFSISLTVATLVFIAITGLPLGIDFTGGVVSTVEYDEASNISRADVESQLNDVFEDVRVVKVLNDNVFQITVPQVYEESGQAMSTEEMQAELSNTLQTSFGEGLQVRSTEQVAALLGSEFAWNAFLLILVTSLVILGYLAVRFRPIFGLGAVAALVHDIIVTIGVFVLLSKLGVTGSITMDIISALLIILGYSVNDTIVIFDRIRETTTETYGKNMGEIINQSINATLSRTLFTGGTTILALFSLLIFGGVGLKDFALVLLVGVIFGTYSSIFVASGVVYTYITAKEKKEGIVKAQGKSKTVRVGA